MIQKAIIVAFQGLIFLAGLFVCTSKSLSAATDCDLSTYNLGVGKSEITGPLIPVGMMGYAEFSQKVSGIHMPLYSRSLFVQDRCGGLPIIMVVNDMAMVFGSLKSLVLKGVNERLPGVFDNRRLLLSATHTHAGIGGFSDRILYNITTSGQHPETLNAIVEGTIESIVQAYQSQEPGTLELLKGESTEDLQFNRSLNAYEKNPEWERAMYKTPFDPNMVVLVAKDLNNESIGSFNWFGVHPVSLSIQNTLVSGDNKGFAAYVVEQSMTRRNHHRKRPHIAGFVQSKAGDISPYSLDLDFLNSAPRDRGWARNLAHGQSQSNLALQIIEQIGEKMVGPVAGLETTQNLAHETFSYNNHTFRTCGGVLGVSFAAGTENARPFPIFKEGTIYGINWPQITLMPKEQQCHGNKVMLLPTGFAKPNSWTANAASFQLIRLGNLLIAALPFEVTTMAGRRIERMLQQATEPFGIHQVVLSSLANEYLHYVTTSEEYSSQQYEGGSNLFGPHSLDAYLSIYSTLATRLVIGPGEKPSPDLYAKPSPHLQRSQKGYKASANRPITNIPPLWNAQTLEHLGKVIQEPSQNIRIGETQKVSWIGVPWKSLDHKKLNLIGTVEEQRNGHWELIADLYDPYTTMETVSRGFGTTHTTMTWSPQTSGYFRFCYQRWSSSEASKLQNKNQFRSCSKGFEVQR